MKHEIVEVLHDPTVLSVTCEDEIEILIHRTEEGWELTVYPDQVCNRSVGTLFVEHRVLLDVVKAHQEM